ncbi:MAG: tetratricopeptide repeat protein [Planctomycetes bacterium]|jgi:tetratricopeptide (TPR) repeat protein|nr:tetratricopeptide repeat protein [Planctomycetota bacterium]
MHPEARWQRAIQLCQHRRWAMAAQELRALLTAEPDHAPAHAMLAQVLAQQDELDAALQEARTAVGLQPDLDFAHGALAAVHWQRGELPAAATAIRAAIELDPDDVGHRATLAQICIAQKRWDEALAAADDGLALSPEHTDCLNLRALALTKLGRRQEAADSVEASLAHDPDNPYTHQTRGYALLHRGDPRQALHHFQEALRRDPTLDGARAGLVEALKARNPIYRVVLGWFLWLGRFSGARQMQIMIGLWLGTRLLSRALRDGGHERLADLVGYSWLGFVLLTSCAVPLFNLILLLHPVGRHALEPGARRDALALGATAATTILVGLHGWLGSSAWSQHGWLFWLLLLLPVAGIGVFHAGWGRRALQIFCTLAVGFWVWWSVRLHQLLAAPGPIEPLRAHGELYGHLLLAVVLSTWFVLLAPKGSPRRRLGADG